MANPRRASSLPADLAGSRLSVGPEARALLRAVRVKQWLKNGLVFIAFVFSIRQAWTPLQPDSWLPLIARSALAFVAFCAVASAEYLVNDMRDLEADRLHPRKRLRPLASGALSRRLALAAVLLLAPAGLLLGFALGWRFGLLLAVYAANALAYSFVLKHIAIVDVLALSIGFVLRTVGGALVIGVPVSPWLYLVTILGALFIGVGKRRHELLLLGDSSAAHRASLDQYTPQLLDQMISVATASTVVAYSLYTVTATNLPANHAMLATLPFVLYGVFRYLLLIYARDEGGNPEEMLLRDRPLLTDIILWILCAGVILFIFR